MQVGTHTDTHQKKKRDAHPALTHPPTSQWATAASAAERWAEHCTWGCPGSRWHSPWQQRRREERRVPQLSVYETEREGGERVRWEMFVFLTHCFKWSSFIFIQSFFSNPSQTFIPILQYPSGHAILVQVIHTLTWLHLTTKYIRMYIYIST